ncbi:STAS domain-containing protein [Idiomarina seosinensis]|uniref:STAS domain-containing protein n=1 Tax=Idiomarina seosinensis TaxID=281739 RepID=UPI00384B4BF6
MNEMKPTSLTIYDIDALQNQYVMKSYWSDAMVINLELIEEFDSAGLQWLTLVKKNLQAGGHGLTLSGASDDLKDAIDLLGMHSLLGVAHVN